MRDTTEVLAAFAADALDAAGEIIDGHAGSIDIELVRRFERGVGVLAALAHAMAAGRDGAAGPSPVATLAPPARR